MLPPNSSQEKIKEQYRKLALKYHPDQQSNLNKHNQEHAFLKTKEAYEALIEDRFREAPVQRNA